MKDTDVAWLAGIVEGEGCFLVDKRSKNPYLIFQLRMVDEDIMQRVADILDCSLTITHPKSWKDRGWDAQYQVRLYGKSAEKATALVYPYLGERRKAKLRELGF